MDSIWQTSSIQVQGVSEARPVNVGHESLQNKVFATSHNKDRIYEMGAGSCAVEMIANKVRISAGSGHTILSRDLMMHYAC